MTTEEKLHRFLDTCMTDARAKSTALYEEYVKEQDRMYEEHVSQEEKQAKKRLQLEQQRLTRQSNMELSREQIRIKKEFSRFQEDLKNKVFIEVQALLEDFMQSPGYEDYLVRKIEEVKANIKEGEDALIYIDPADTNMRLGLEVRTGMALAVSEYGFGGGIRCLIPGRHILIDESFAAKLAGAKEKFRFHGGVESE